MSTSTTASAVPDVIGRRAVVVWAVGLAAYLVGVMHRTSFGIAGLDAAERFDATPAVLSGFIVLQLLVYAVLQVPAGVLLDRFGARRLIVVGALTMAVGQAVLAVAEGLPLAIAARVLVGAGDALTFLSVLSVLVAWFPARRVPLMTQLTGLLGQLGQVASAVPLAALLHGPGWTAAFGSAAALGVAVAIAVAAVVRNRPPHAPPPPPAPGLAEVLAGVRAAWSEPGTRLGLWSHAGTQFSATVFVLLWGVPYLVAEQGLSTGAASVLLTILVGVWIVVGPVFGEFTARHPMRRSLLIIGVIVATAAVWTVVLAVPPPAPWWLLVLLMAVLACGGPGSVIGFDYARTFNPAHRQGAAVGIVNVGGFVASLLVAWAVGLVLSSVGSGAGSGGYTPEAFRVAWTVQYVVWAAALAGVLVSRRRARRKLATEGVVVPSLRSVLAARRTGRS